MPTEKEMLDQLRRGGIELPPLVITALQGSSERYNHFDAVVEASWGRNRAKFVVECKALSTPKAFQDGINRLKAMTIPQGCSPLLFVPFLSEEKLVDLEKDGISGIDLCGNGVVIAPDRFAVFRSAGENRFPSSASIKNIYRKNSSMVGRLFLASSPFDRVQNVCTAVNQLNPLVQQWEKKAMSLSTVSKVLKALEDDLIVTRQGGIGLLQPDKLLQKLRENFEPPNITRRTRLKVSDEKGDLSEMLRKASQESGVPLVVTGASSMGRYAAVQGGAVFSLYCPRLDGMLERLRGSESDRFPDLEIVETADETAYFDARQGDGFLWASPLQTYLELMAGDKRDQETAGQVRSFIMNNLSGGA